MTAIPTAHSPLFFWFKRKTERTMVAATEDGEDLRREYMTRMIASEGCCGEYGAQALMGLFPKDF